MENSIDERVDYLATNFDEIIDRKKTDSVKWSINEQLFGKEDVLAMWVADMDFRAPEAVVNALIQRAAQGIYGYAAKPDSYYQAVIDWMKKRHGWETRRSWQVTTPGVVPALSIATLAFTQPGDKIIIQSPVYHPFFRIIKNNGRQVVENLLINDQGYYRMDFEQLDQQLADPRVRMMILCSPHNPVGRVWTREELARLGELCLKHDVLVISDEIHSDLVYSWAKHTPYASISPEMSAQSVTLMAPSKTFNLAGLYTSVALIPDRKLNNRFSQVIESLGIGGSSVFGLTGLEAAYRYGEEWLAELLTYLEGNLNFLEKYVAECIPQIKVRKPEGTYLVWLDCTSLGLKRAELRKFMIEHAGLGLDEGAVFGDAGEGFMRLNAACPRAVLQKALSQLAQAVTQKFG
jgi:cysteine-S-conjugate beta-lyase